MIALSSCLILTNLLRVILIKSKNHLDVKEIQNDSKALHAFIFLFNTKVDISKHVWNWYSMTEEKNTMEFRLQHFSKYLPLCSLSFEFIHSFSFGLVPYLPGVATVEWSANFPAFVLRRCFHWETPTHSFTNGRTQILNSRDVVKWMFPTKSGVFL